MPARYRHRTTPAAKGPPSFVLWTVLAVALSALLVSSYAVVARALQDGDGPRERIAYFADWNTANRGYTIKDVEDSGSAERLTRLVWAFGDVNDRGLCHIEAGTDQSWQIFQRRYTAEASVDGAADRYEQPLAGSLNQLRKLQRKHPGLKASISLGGWNWSRYFSDAARTRKSREQFVTSCVDLWLRGNLPKHPGEPQGGEGAAEGIFDGIDLDWEWPGGSGHPDNTVRPGDRRNFTLMVAEFRNQLDALESETGVRYTLSVSLSHSEEIMRSSYEPEVFQYLDFASVQGYDFTGSWSQVTGHHSQLYAPKSDPKRISADSAVRQYLDYGLAADKLVLGLPGYGRGWSGVAPGPTGTGRFTEAESEAEGGYGEATDDYDTLELREGKRFFDKKNGAYWIYDGDDWWSYDTPDVVRLKGEYVKENHLLGLMLWNLDMDSDGELVAAMDESLGS